MKKLNLLIFISVLLFSCTSNIKKEKVLPPDITVKNTETTLEIIPYTKEGLSKLLVEIKKNEPTAKKVLFDKESNLLYIAVYDDGTDRKGLAEYYCQLCKDFDVAVTGVYIVKYKSRDLKIFDQKLGYSNCKF